MKPLILVALVIGIWVQPSRKPIERVVQGKGASRTNESNKAKQDQQSTETEAIQGILAQATQIQQQKTQELADRKNQQGQDVGTNRQIKNYTFGLVIVGALQGLILAFTVWAIYRQTSAMQNGERAWIMVDIEWDGVSREITHMVGDMSSDGRTITPIIAYRNDGKSPAWITEKRIRFVHIKSLPRKPDFGDAVPFDSGLEPLSPKGKGKTKITLKSDIPVHPGELGYLYGVIKYRDIFGKNRATHFGYQINLLTDTAKRLTERPEYNQNT